MMKCYLTNATSINALSLHENSIQQKLTLIKWNGEGGIEEEEDNMLWHA